MSVVSYMKIIICTDDGQIKAKFDLHGVSAPFPVQGDLVTTPGGLTWLVERRSINYRSMNCVLVCKRVKDVSVPR